MKLIIVYCMYIVEFTFDQTLTLIYLILISQGISADL